MKTLNDEELFSICGGGTTFTSSYINAIVKGIDSLLDVGRSLGGAIRRWIEGSMCKL